MRNRLIVVGLAVTVGVPALSYAQTADATAPQNPVVGAPAASSSAVGQLSPVINPQGADSQTRYQMQMYEGVLKSAITRAGQRLAEVVQRMSPVVLGFETDPVAHFVLVPGSGPVFTLEAPRIQKVSVSLFQMSREMGRAPAAGSASQVSATGVVTPDPDKGPDIPANFDPDATYTTFVREEIVTAMLDLSSQLNLKPEESLTIAASSLDFASNNALYPTSSSRMSFQIKGADLIALHQGRITRAEAVSKITQTKF